MHSYIAYNLKIYSDLPLPELVSSNKGQGVDVLIQFGSINRRPVEPEPRQGCFHATSDTAYFFWDAVGALQIQGGREIIIEPTPDVDKQLLRLIILGMALGTLLHQRGLFTLHASAAVINGVAVAFVGGKGAGKSTIAAAMYAGGHPVMADDIVALNMNGTANPMLLPGFPQLKLWPDVAGALVDVPAAMRQLHPQLEKRGRCVDDSFPQVSYPLRGIYLLATSTYQEVELLQPQDIFLDLISHSYALRFLGTTGATASHFRQCMQLINAVPIRRLKRPYVLSALSDLVRFVEEDIGCAIEPATA